MADTLWRITYYGPREKLSDAGLTFHRGISMDIEDASVASYFQLKNNFEVQELGESAEIKKDFSENRQNETTLNESEQQVSDVDADNVTPVNQEDDLGLVSSRSAPNPPLPTGRDLAENMVARSQLAGLTSDPGRQVPNSTQEIKEEEETTKETTKKSGRRGNKKKDVFANQLIDPDTLLDKE